MILNVDLAMALLQTNAINQINHLCSGLQEYHLDQSHHLIYRFKSEVN